VSLTFGDYRLDLGARQLFRGLAEVHLPPKAFDLLTLLLEKRPHAVSKKDIYQQVWPGVYVTDVSLATLIAELRRTLDDQQRPHRFVRTVHGFGYAFCGPIDAGPDAYPTADMTGDQGCWVLWEGREIPLKQGANIIGRATEAAVRADLPSVSRRHAAIVVSTEGATLEDLGSKNGTLLRGVPITGVEPLKDLDEIQVGSVRLTLRIMHDEAPTEKL
jgi:DNA-binding winged helix-turn-helix (wHTH) protein